MKFFYVTSARVPGQKAHCSQIAQMCRAFLNGGVDMELLHPARAKLAIYKGRTIEQWYGFDRKIESRQLSSVDFLSGLPAGLPKFIYRVAFRVMVGTYVKSLIKYLKKHDGDYCIYSRDVHVLSKIMKTFPSAKKIAELHSVVETHGAAYKMENEVMQACDGLVVLTSLVKDILVERGFAADHVLVESSAVDPKVFPGTATREDARDKLDLPQQGRIVGYVGNFHTLGLEKGLDTIVGSIPSVIREYPDTMFYFVGGPLSYAKSYIKTLQELKVPKQNYKFIDRQPYKEIHLWLAASDVLTMLLPSHPRFDKVTSPLKTFEYMTSGRPMIVSDLPSMRDVLSDEKNALLVPPSDASALAKAIIRLFDQPDLAKRLAEQAREDVQNKTWDARAVRITKWISTLS